MNGQGGKLSTEAIYKNLAMIWLVLFMSQFLFLVVVYFVEPGVFEFDFTKPVIDQNALIILIFAAVGLLNFALSFVLKKKFLDQATSEQNVSFVQTAMIVGCALCESVTLFGVMLAFVAEYQYFFAWFFVGILGMLFHFPKRDNLIAASFKKEQM
ncbi:MAG: hypothetical protein KDB79_14155 [Acidobacteria bacterium]|nr:hypothetical protein [Acidobacteriota bacterium]